MKYLIRVQANHDCWIADGSSDPSRTTIKKHAKVFSKKHIAEKRKVKLEREYPNRAFSVEPV